MTDILPTLQRWLADPNVIKLIEVAIGILIISIVSKTLGRILPRQIQDGDLRYRLRKAINIIGYVATVLLIITVFNSSLGQLTVIFGVAGAGIAFALQEVIASIAGWAAVSFGQFYKPGDRVQLGGITGDVIDISPLRTTVMEIGGWVKADLYNGRIVRIANSFVFKEPVYNYSADFPFVWDEINIPVKYGSDHRLAREILYRVADEVVGEYVEQAQNSWNTMVRKYLIEDAKVKPTIALVTNDNWMEFTLRYVVDYKYRRIKKDELFTRMLDESLATNGRVEYASATFQLVQAPTFNVRLTDDRADLPATPNQIDHRSPLE
ncbi:MAG: mechanosensitive ion channel family protein [Chamaesiphon sp.]|nr:mechanosensitive ion channel family protein [Chamaesiphon sp.]